MGATTSVAVGLLAAKLVSEAVARNNPNNKVIQKVKEIIQGADGPPIVDVRF
jgi:type IV secretory pathway VirB2 component (pilin)